MKITAAVARTPNAPFALEQIQLDEPRANEVRVRIVGVGLCHTDLVGNAGVFPLSFPAVFGHEGAGIVDKIGSAVTKVAVGDRVALTFLSCGHCPNCESDQPAYCHQMPPLNYTGLRSDGSKTLSDDNGAISGSFFGQSSFANFALAEERNLVKVPDDVPLEIMGPLGCGIQTGAGAIMRSLACKPGSSLLICGGGAVGLAAVLGAAIQQCGTVIVVEPQPARRELALQLGATHVIDPKAQTDLNAAVRAIVPAGVNYVFDTTGIPAVMEGAVAALAPLGTFGFVGVPADPQTKLPGRLSFAMMMGHTYRGIIEGDSDPDVFIPQLIELYRAGRFAFDRMIKTYPFTDINRAIDEQHKGECVKAVLLFDQM